MYHFGPFAIGKINAEHLTTVFNIIRVVNIRVCVYTTRTDVNDVLIDRIIIVLFDLLSWFFFFVLFIYRVVSRGLLETSSKFKKKNK